MANTVDDEGVALREGERTAHEHAAVVTVEGDIDDFGRGGGRE